MIKFSNAVRNPRTMVVHPHDALSALLTMVCSHRLRSAAFQAKSNALNIFYKIEF